MRAPVAILAMAALVGAVAGHPAAAKPPSPKPAPSVDNVFWMVDCLIKEKDRDLERVLSTVPGDRGSEVPWILAAVGPCLVEGRPIPAASFFKRGAVAERFLYRDFSSIGGVSVRRPVALFAPVGSEYSSRAEPHSLAALIMLDAASCLVRADPQRAYAFFRLIRGSSEESLMVSAMAPGLAGCLTEGQPLKLTPAIFRAFLAEAAYRVAAGQPDVIKVEP